MFKAVNAKYSFNKFLSAFKSPSDAGARSVLNFVDEDASVQAGASYLTDTLKVMTRDQKRKLNDFSIETVKEIMEFLILQNLNLVLMNLQILMQINL